MHCAAPGSCRDTITAENAKGAKMAAALCVLCELCCVVCPTLLLGEPVRGAAHKDNIPAHQRFAPARISPDISFGRRASRSAARVRDCFSLIAICLSNGSANNANRFCKISEGRITLNPCTSDLLTEPKTVPSASNLFQPDWVARNK